MKNLLPYLPYLPYLPLYIFALLAVCLLIKSFVQIFIKN